MNESQWIDVNERLPKYDGRFIVFIEIPYKKQQEVLPPKLFVCIGTWADGFWDRNKVTHWMPLPQPPEQKD